VCLLGSNIQFSVLSRGLLLAALASKEDLLRAAERMAGPERPSNGDVEGFRDYEAQIGQMIFGAMGVTGNAPRRMP
jgi:hypothetical protein